MEVITIIKRRTMLFLLIGLFILAFLFIFSTYKVSATEITYSDPTTDGYIWYSGGGVSDGNKVDTFLVESTSAGGTTRYVSYIEWDISAIPDSATILEVGFNVYGDGYSTAATMNYAKFKQMLVQPSIQTWDLAGITVIYNDLWSGAGTIYKSIAHNSFTDDAYININDTGGTAWDISPKTDIQNSLAVDWFAIGFVPGAGNTGYSARMDSENNTEGHIMPTLWIHYAITSPEVVESFPADGETGVNISTCLGVNITHPNMGSGYNEYHIPIAIDSDFMDKPLINAPILVVINSTIGAFCGANGEYIRFLDYANNTLLPYEIELWDSVGNSYVWVNVSRINATGADDTYIWLVYGNHSWADGQSTHDVWDSHYRAVYHMNISSDPLYDSTAFNNISIATQGTPIMQLAGKMGYGIFYWYNEYHQIPNAVLLTAEANAGYTIETWENINYSRAGAGQDNEFVGLYKWSSINHGIFNNLYWHYTNPPGGLNSVTAISNNTNTWSYSASTKDATHKKIYVNATCEGSQAQGAIVSSNQRNVVGGDYSGSYCAGAILDEIRISDITRNNSWLNASYHSANQSAGFLTWGTTETNETNIGVSNNITWYWYNGTGFEEFSRTEGIIVNGTYYNCSHTSTLNLTPCTEYYWMVHIEDINGNYTEDVFSFTTFCLDPPTSLTCDRINATTLNLTWTPMPDHNGTTYTIIRYSQGYSYPGITDGTELYNGTSYHINLTGLPATCYAWSAWTYWHAPNGTWMLSANKASKICCMAGGDYLVYFRYENTSIDTQNNLINLSLFPYSTHRIVLKYTNGLEDVVWIDNTSINPINVAASSTLLYIEAWWNYSVNQTVDYNTTASYYRRLTTNAVWNDSGNLTFDFYFIVDRPIYGDYRNFYPNLTLYESELEDNLVRYIYSYYDFTGKFSNYLSNNIFSSIFTFNSTKQLIIDEDYWDAAQKVYSVLLYGKNYWQKVYNVEDEYSLYIGFCPTDNILQENLYINVKNATSDISNALITYDWVGATGGWILYINEQTEYPTTAIRLRIYENNTDSTPIYYDNQTGDAWNFSAGTMTLLNHSKFYMFELEYVRNITTDIHDIRYLSRTFTGTFVPGISAKISAAYIDTIFENIFGLPPFYKPGDATVYIPWTSLIALAISIIVGFGLAGVDHSGVAPCLGFGITLCGLTFLISGLSTLYVLGIGVIVLGLILLLGRGK